MVSVFLPGYATAADAKITSSTQYLWYNDIFSSSDDNDTEIAEYLRLNVTKLNESGTAAIYGYGRATKEIDSSDDNDDAQGRLYYLYLDYRDLLKDVLDVKAGRHFVYIPSASGLIDGATLDFKNIGPLGLRLLGGRDVRFLEERNEITGADDKLLGASLYTTLFRLTHLEASYAKRLDDGDTAREIAGANVSIYLPKNIALYGETRYDMLVKATSELLAGLRLSPVEKLTLKIEHYQSYPQFDATSIYSVFAVDKYTENLVRAEYALGAASRLSVGYAKEKFNGDEDADLYEAGITTKPSDNLSLNVSYDKRNGYGGRLGGWRLNGSYAVGKASLSAGADYDDFRRETFDSSVVKKYWAGAAYKLGEDASFVIRAEDNINVNYDHNYQGMVALNANF